MEYIDGPGLIPMRMTRYISPNWNLYNFLQFCARWKERQMILACTVLSYFPFSALTLLVGRQEGHTACKKLGFGLLVVTF